MSSRRSTSPTSLSAHFIYGPVCDVFDNVLLSSHHAGATVCVGPRFEVPLRLVDAAIHPALVVLSYLISDVLPDCETLLILSCVAL